MSETGRNDPCPCGSNRKYKQCHGSTNPPPEPHSAPTPPMATPPDPGAVENPFKRIFNDDGTLNEKYVLSRLQHFESLLREKEAFFPIRFDRVKLETLLAENQDIFEAAGDQEGFEASFRRFAKLALDTLVTKEFDTKAKETLRTALHDSDLTQRDRAGAACAMVMTLPEEGPPPQAHDENPFFDMVLRVTFNESMARVDFLQGLSKEEDLNPTERDARFQEFLRSVPALLYEIQQGFQSHVQKALESYHRGEFSFGIGVDMILHGLRAIRGLTAEYEETPEEERTEEENRKFSERFGKGIQEAFAEDIGPEEEREILERMFGFLEGARSGKAKNAVKGLTAALEVMHENAEVRHRMIFAAYHEAVTGSRIYREEDEEPAARGIVANPSELDAYLTYGGYLEKAGHATRAERVYRAALGLFPDEEAVRERLRAVAEVLEPERIAEVQAKIKATEEIEAEETSEGESE